MHILFINKCIDLFLMMHEDHNSYSFDLFSVDIWRPLQNMLRVALKRLILNVQSQLSILPGQRNNCGKGDI